MPQYTIFHDFPLYFGDGAYYSSELVARDLYHHSGDYSLLQVVAGRASNGVLTSLLRREKDRLQVEILPRFLFGRWCRIIRLLLNSNVIQYGHSGCLAFSILARCFRVLSIFVLDADPANELIIAARNPRRGRIFRSLAILKSLELNARIRFACGLSTLVLCVGDGVALSYKSHKNQIHSIVASNIFESEVLSEQKAKEKWTRLSLHGVRPIKILLPAQLRFKKGIHLALRAMMDLQCYAGRFSLTIIGNGPDLDHLEKMALPLADTVKFHKFVRYGSDYFAFLDQFDIGLVPQLSNEQPRVLTELMARGLVVVASDTGGNRTLIKDQENGFLFDAGSCESLSSVLTAIMRVGDSNPERLANVAIAGVRTALEHTVSKVHMKRNIIIANAFSGQVSNNKGRVME